MSFLRSFMSSATRSALSATTLTPSGHLNIGDSEFKKRLSKVQFEVLREARTEPRGITVSKGGFDDHFDPNGKYLCAACDSPLYTSEMKFDCGCGWPGFWTNIPNAVAERPETDGSNRTEIICSACCSHCVNSVSLKFQPNEYPNSPIVPCTYNGIVY
jgi:peptide-methionine (R)-S-oxide reductase